MKKCILCLLSLVLLAFGVMAVDGVKVSASVVDIDISAKSYIVVDNNKKVLMSKNEDARREVASICKLMTTLITLEKIEAGELSLDDKLLTSIYASEVEGSQAFLDGGSAYLVADLIKSVIVASANDSAIVLAEGIAGSEKAFVKLMNDRARTLGMNNTLYANSTGLPAPEQYSTARDTALLLKEIGSHELYHKYSNIWMDYLTHPSGRKTELVNTNRNIRYYDYCELGKTGFTDEAGYCLASKNTKGDLTIFAVVLGADSSADRFTDSMKLCNYTFANFVSEKVVSKGQQIDNNVKVTRGKKSNIVLEAESVYYVTRKVGEGVPYSVDIVLPKSIEAKVCEGDKIGEILITIDGVVDGTTNVVASEDIDKENYFDVTKRVIDSFGFVN